MDVFWSKPDWKNPSIVLDASKGAGGVLKLGAEARGKGQKPPNSHFFFSDFGHFILKIEEKKKNINTYLTLP